MSMDILELIEENYALKPLRWKQKNEVMETDSGTKRLRIWSSEQLMNWHFHWREQLESNDLLTDRMIRTRRGKWHLPYEGSFLTLHDERYEPFPKNGYEQNWGFLIGRLLTNSINQMSDNQEHVQESRDELYRSFGLHRTDLNLPLLNRSIPEARKRLTTFDNIRSRYRHLKIPYLESTLMTHQGKRVHGRFFWQGGEGEPQRGLQGLCELLSDWRISTDTQSLYKLLDSIHETFPIEGGYDQLLAAELIAPREVQRCIQRLESGETNTTSATLDQFEREWEANRTLVEEVCHWIDHRSKKVIT
ncbi:hypothetical protein [Pseudalkalibacillus berkeleyi]|uniref:DUF4375 domain-containing protein n=1 Tax=Pseudalkalibacillus berkeleyi TaxID=1069813 RepID=A0ABS9H240_9BACL|nr:hypothetical protein [Pseudalkalibacillus berkeleyi]MCF6138116.1 hypothetical protein [Pseudalkalibacillus berkeleyi]